eukprot:8310277-Prorocentrum_lima.AAC.1
MGPKTRIGQTQATYKATGAQPSKVAQMTGVSKATLTQPRVCARHSLQRVLLTSASGGRRGR